MEEISYLSHDGETRIHALIWIPDGEIKGVVQIVHGMSEHIARYDGLAKYLNGLGFAVCGEDHLGHGKSVKDKADLGYFTKKRDTDIVLNDINSLRLAMQKQLSDKPYFVLGHSMGSFFTEAYASKYGNSLAGVLILGTGYKNRTVLNVALCLTWINALFFGWKHRNGFMKEMAINAYNKQFKSENDKNAWLSVNMQNRADYAEDELCGADFTNNGYAYLFGIIKRAYAMENLKKIPKNLPVLFLSGKDDPVGDFTKGVKKAAEKFELAGVKSIKVEFAEGRHEILNDDCKMQTFRIISDFLNAQIK